MNIAFVGNPNVGKTAMINAIAGSKLKVGNWPGVTVEKKTATLFYKGKKVTLTDLPGVYSLSPYSLEERITRDFILEEETDCIVNVIDSTNLERNLYLTLLLMETEKPIVLALNMFDELKKSGYKLDIKMISKILGVDIVPTTAIKKEGLDTLMDLALNQKTSNQKTIKYKLRYEGFLEKEIESVIEKLKENKISSRYPLRWIAIKLIEKDEYALKKLKEETSKDLSSLAKDNIMRIEERFSEDTEAVLAETRYGIINGILRRALIKPHKTNINITEKLDKVFLNRFLGLPIFFALMYYVFKFTFDGSAPLIDWMDSFINGFIAKYIQQAISFSPLWFQFLVIKGIISGVGLVLSFVPLMFFLYFFLALLEESGYMARAAFVMDRLMGSLGLNGKAFIPLILGFGCNVPAIYATRSLENESDRKLTAIMIPFMSCGARLPIYSLFTGVFFVSHRALIVLSLYTLGIFVAFTVSSAFEKNQAVQSR